MHVPINVKSPNNISEWQMGFNSAFKGLIVIIPSAISWSPLNTETKKKILLNAGNRPPTRCNMPEDSNPLLYLLYTSLMHSCTRFCVGFKQNSLLLSRHRDDVSWPQNCGDSLHFPVVVCQLYRLLPSDGVAVGCCEGVVVGYRQNGRAASQTVRGHNNANIKLLCILAAAKIDGICRSYRNLWDA